MHACAGKKKKKPHQSSVFVHQKFQLDRVHLQEVKRSSYEHTKKCADQLLLLGQVSITRWWYIYGWIDFLFCVEYIKHAFIHMHRHCHIRKCVMFEPNQAEWTISAAFGLPGVWACRDLCDLILGVSTLPLITGCNQWLVCWRCWASLQQMKRAKIYIIPSDYSVLFSFCLCCICHDNLITGLSPCLPQTDRAVQLLLETSADNPSYYCDSLKACLVTTITSSGPSQSTIKLVATNMIANGKLAGSICVADSC